MRVAVELNGVVVLVVNGGGASYIYNQEILYIPRRPIASETLLLLLLPWLPKAFTRQAAPSLVEIPYFHCPN